MIPINIVDEIELLIYSYVEFKLNQSARTLIHIHKIGKFSNTSFIKYIKNSGEFQKIGSTWISIDFESNEFIEFQRNFKINLVLDSFESQCARMNGILSDNYNLLL